MSNGNGHRWSKFWWQDWMRDEGLRSCTFAAQGLWMRMLCIAHEAEPCGHVLINGKPPSLKKLASMGSTTEKEVAKLLAELEEEGVFSRTDDGTIYSRRMVRDAAASDAGREHIAKRWKDDRPTSPPIRGGNREPTRRPNGEDNSPPSRTPITPEADTDSEAESEERKGLINKTSLLPSTPARAETRQSDALDELLSDAGIEKPPRIDRTNDTPPSDDPLILAHVRRLTQACRMTVPYSEVRSADAQIDGLRAQPAAVGADETMGLKFQPAENVNDIAAQTAAALAGVTAEQIAKAQRAFAWRQAKAA